jgi:hypothetical protein
LAQSEIHAVSGVYVGGHIRRQRPNTVTKLRDSGFTYVILFNVDVQSDGTLKTDGETICQNGEYVFQKTQPHYVEDVIALKTPPTSINRLEICIGGWGNQSYVNIKNLIQQHGTGKNTMLYRNFKALLEAVPGIDAVNNDDEHGYDVATAVKFHVMMADLGLKTTLAPYTNRNFWTQLATQVNSQRPGTVDRVMIQCYDGGAGNNPSNWNFPGIERHAGRTNYQTSMDESIQQMATWQKNGAATGAFVWVYNDETWDLNAWASAMNRTFTARPVSEEETGAIAYSNTNFKGYAVRLPEGSHSMADLAVLGLKAQDMESMKLIEGYTVRLHKSTDCSGAPWPVKSDKKSFTTTWANQVRSIEVEKLNPDGIADVQTTQPRISVTNGSITVSDARNLILRITDITGGPVMQTRLTEDVQSFSLAPLPHGIYIVRIGEKSIKISI